MVIEAKCTQSVLALVGDINKQVESVRSERAVYEVKLEKAEKRLATLESYLGLQNEDGEPTALPDCVIELQRNLANFKIV